MFNEEDKDEKRDKQTNVQKPKNVNQNQQQKSKQNQSNNAQTDQQTQFDVEGSDILYQLANKLKNKQAQEAPPETKGEKPEKKQEGMKEIEQPKMNPEQAHEGQEDQ